MKKLMLFTCLCFLSIGAQAADFEYLVFTLSDGTKKAVTASNLTIQFSEGNLLASSGNELLATLPLATLSEMEFSNDNTSGIITSKGIATKDIIEKPNFPAVNESLNIR